MEIVALISGKGGVGKSTLAANLAVALSQRKKRVLLLDLDPQNVQRLHLGMDPDEIAGLVREGIYPESIFNSPFGPQFIPFGRARDEDLEAFEAHLLQHPQWLANGIAVLDDGQIDFVIIDTPPGPNVFLHQAMRAAHRALVVLLADAASFATVAQITALVAEYTAGRTDFAGMHFLINQMPQQSKLAHQVRSALYANYPDHVVPMVVHQEAAVAQALAFERPVLQMDPACRASMDIQSVAEWLLASIE